jgi:hypothetical protein
MSRAERAADTTDVTAAEPQTRGRGAELLLDHCEALDTEHLSPTAKERLEGLVGDSLARLLVGALSTRRPRSVDVD